MKKITIILFFLTGSLVSQNKDRFTNAILFEPQHYVNIGGWEGDGFNIGLSWEYQMPKLMYFKAQFFMFPNLNGIDYYDGEGVVGIHHRDSDDCLRYFVGFKGGVVYRTGPTPKLGFETGIEYYFRSGLYIGIQPSFNYRTDGDVWGANERNYWQFDCPLKIGIWLN